jgi:hypothetical protein
MSTVSFAWEAFVGAIEEASALQRSPSPVNTVADVLQYARELLDIIEDELAFGSDSAEVKTARGALAHLRRRLGELEKGVLPTRH